MQLSYRGLNYESNAVYLTKIENELPGKYRGNAYKIRQHLEVPTQQFFALKHRDVAYRTVTALGYRDANFVDV